jgi:hypothetical protein
MRKIVLRIYDFYIIDKIVLYKMETEKINIEFAKLKIAPSVEVQKPLTPPPIPIVWRECTRCGARHLPNMHPF